MLVGCSKGVQTEDARPRALGAGNRVSGLVRPVPGMRLQEAPYLNIVCLQRYTIIKRDLEMLSYEEQD